MAGETKKIKKDYKCRMGECPFCLALRNTNHSDTCRIMIGSDSDKDIFDIINFWNREKNCEGLSPERKEHFFVWVDSGIREICFKCGLVRTVKL